MDSRTAENWLHDVVVPAAFFLVITASIGLLVIAIVLDGARNAIRGVVVEELELQRQIQQTQSGAAKVEFNE